MVFLRVTNAQPSIGIYKFIQSNDWMPWYNRVLSTPQFCLNRTVARSLPQIRGRCAGFKVKKGAIRIRIRGVTLMRYRIECDRFGNPYLTLLIPTPPSFFFFPHLTSVTRWEKGQVILYPIWVCGIFFKIKIPYFDWKVNLCRYSSNFPQEFRQKSRGCYPRQSLKS